MTIPASLSADETRRFRILSQGLDTPPAALNGPATKEKATGPGNDADSIMRIVRRAAGIQAQDMNTAPLQVRARSAATLTSHDVTHALSEERSLIRTWVMRGTLHIIPAEDHRWMTALFGPAAFSAGRGRRLQLGIDERTLDMALSHTVEILNTEGPLTRQQLAERLAPLGITVADQGFHHILRSGGFLGVLCHGPLLEGKTETVVTADAWLAGVERPELGREEALARLALTYIRAFGPSTPRDLAVWAGLPLRDARAGWQAIEETLIEVEAAGEQMWIHEDDASRLDSLSGDGNRAEPSLRLLSFFDTYLLGYRGRGLAVDAAHLTRVNAGGGMIRPVVIIDGQAVATWSLKRDARKGVAEVSIEPFTGYEGVLAADWAQHALHREIEDIRRFLGMDAPSPRSP